MIITQYTINLTREMQGSQQIEQSAVDEVEYSYRDDVTVLIVDDEEDIANLYQHRVNKYYDSITAYSGEEALDKLDSTIDVVVLDRRMPGMTGGEVLSEIRDRGCDCKVIMSTAVDPTGDDVESLPYDSYMTKPIGESELIDEINKNLRVAKLNEMIRLENRLQSKIEFVAAEEHDLTSELESSELRSRLENQLERVRQYRAKLE